ncbi:phospholipid/cholesterol/gamma-HCH transport system substrate-binding protein [Aeromicrobium panaciterrae]|uniref:Phospholipid/cholesterol/gamma-HCH transport system substrate-binding protein n=1 Tax=Aeromicrobium panaciterrae TaxID=363861 RepID=A0ABU1UQ67_9ACTN|nr:MlaD family protein [Aeromicrobium panaciterrae]MDR7087323.1 phospholipid/cholesterol/gamma-HCH transport system substrate-binding protein [Aeromicrobium panaciterrae]
MRRRVHRKHFVAAIGLLGIFLATIAYLYGAILDGSLTKRPVHVAVELEETGGLFGGSGVTYRGVRVGKVESVKLDDGRIVAMLNLEPSAHVPADSEAAVRTLSPAGEQYLDFQPTASKGPWLKNGDTIEATHTATPTSIATALESIDSLMSQIDSDDLATVLDELHTAFSDTDDLSRILTSGSHLVDLLDESWPQTLRTLENARTVLRTGVESKDQFVELSSSLKSLTASLEEYDPKLRSILDKTPKQVKEIRALTASIANVLPDFLTAADDLTGTLADRDPHLRQLLTDFPNGLQRLADTIVEGFLRVNMLVSPGEVCSYGVDQPSPRSTDREPLVHGRECTANVSGQQRGSAHVPAPLR